MKVYEIIKDCSITHTRNGEDNSFALYPGDFFFIEPDFFWLKKENRLNHESPYSKKSMLVKIYHNKLVISGDKPEDTKYEWTWINNINIIEPSINNLIFKDFDKPNPFTGSPVCKDVTTQWHRDQKLNQLIYAPLL